MMTSVGETGVQAAVVFGPNDLRVVPVGQPDLGSGLVEVRTVYGGICGSDLHYVSSGANGAYVLREAMVLGHEVVGVVNRIGANVEVATRVGAPVAIHPATPAPAADDTMSKNLHLDRAGVYLGSAASYPHTQGAFAESIHVRPEQLREIPEALPLRRAVLAEPLSVAIHGVDRVRTKIAGARILVSGAGPIGLLAAAALKERGAGYVAVSDVHPFPLSIARNIGADETVLLSESRITEDSFDIVVECSGVLPSFKGAIDAVRRGGDIVQLGILPNGDVGAPLSTIGSKELTLHGSQRFDNEMGEALTMLSEHPELQSIITHTFDLEQAGAAFAVAADASKSSKVVLSIADDPAL